MAYAPYGGKIVHHIQKKNIQGTLVATSLTFYLVRTKRFWNNILMDTTILKRWESQIIQKYFGTSILNGLNMIAKIS
jgi:hypothetical protein